MLLLFLLLIELHSALQSNPKKHQLFRPLTSKIHASCKRYSNALYEICFLMSHNSARNQTTNLNEFWNFCSEFSIRTYNWCLAENLKI